jgi:hypothetical protein
MTEGDRQYTEYLNLDIDFNEIQSHADYKEVWKRFSPVKVQMKEKKVKNLNCWREK